MFLFHVLKSLTLRIFNMSWAVSYVEPFYGNHISFVSRPSYIGQRELIIIDVYCSQLPVSSWRMWLSRIYEQMATAVQNHPPNSKFLDWFGRFWSSSGLVLITNSIIHLEMVPNAEDDFSMETSLYKSISNPYLHEVRLW